jgi:hypothetical protein
MNNNIATPEKKTNTNFITKGVFFIGLGLFFLLRSFTLPFPEWVVSWETFLLAFGAYKWFSSGMKNNGGLIMMLVASIFLAIKIIGLTWNINMYIWPIGAIAVGIYLLVKPRQCQKSL